MARSGNDSRACINNSDEEEKHTKKKLVEPREAGTDRPLLWIGNTHLYYTSPYFICIIDPVDCAFCVANLLYVIVLSELWNTMLTPLTGLIIIKAEANRQRWSVFHLQH